jgi:hypothetical protein
MILGDSVVAIASGINNAVMIGAGGTLSQSNTVILGANNDVGIGTSTPTNKLHIVGANPLRLQGAFSATTDSTLTIDVNGLVHKGAPVSGVATLSDTLYTTTGTKELANNIGYVYINPASVLASLTLKLPATPTNNQRVEIISGGTIASGAAVLTSFTINGNGNSILQSLTPTAAFSGDVHTYKFSTAISKWVRVK